MEELQRPLIVTSFGGTKYGVKYHVLNAKDKLHILQPFFLSLWRLYVLR